MPAETVKPLNLPAIETGTYRITDVAQVRTPALAIYPQIVDANVDITLGQMGGDTNRWRPHVKTSKLGFIMQRLVRRGVHQFKCSTSLELLTIIDAGAKDVLLAYPSVGANAARVVQIAAQHRGTRISSLVENTTQIAPWKGSNVGLFIDVNPGMNRTGLEQERIGDLVRLAQAIIGAGIEFRGLHYYDGHLAKYPFAERERVAHQGYDRLMKVVEAFNRENVPVDEVITAGTPAFPAALTYQAFRSASFIHRVSPGTVVYCDCTTFTQLPESWNYRPAAVVVSSIVSHPTTERITCDAGHKTVSADSGVPTCAVIGHPGLVPSRPSEEHLPMDVTAVADDLATGDTVYLVPRHVCPTVNNFDHALIIEGGRIVAVEPVSARGREVPIEL